MLMPEVAKEPVVSWQFLDIRSGHPMPALHGRTRSELFWARNGIFQALGALKTKQHAHILVPAYICSSAVDPIIAYGADVEFYRVDSDCKADLTDIESRIRPETVALLIVHYFGAPQSIPALRALCDRHGLWLLEDCAHVLVGAYEGAPLGSFGDVSVFSWRKFLPTYDGATLFINRPFDEVRVSVRRESLLLSLQVLLNLLERWAERPGYRVRRLWRCLFNMLHRAREAIRKRPNEGAVPSSVDSNAGHFDAEMADLPMTRFSRAILRHSDVAAVSAARRSNYDYLHRALISIANVEPLWNSLPSGVTPWIFPLRVDQGAQGLAALRSAGIPAVSWSGVCPRTLLRQQFPEADRLYDHLLFLPLHQDLQRHDLDVMVCTIRSILGAPTRPDKC